jgi:hypothetical protein
MAARLLLGEPGPFTTLTILSPVDLTNAAAFSVA